MHFADKPSCVVAKYVITWTPAAKECPGTFDLNTCFIGCLLSNVGSFQWMGRAFSCGFNCTINGSGQCVTIGGVGSE